MSLVTTQLALLFSIQKTFRIRLTGVLYSSTGSSPFNFWSDQNEF